MFYTPWSFLLAGAFAIATGAGQLQIETRTHTSTYDTHTHIYTCVYIYIKHVPDLHHKIKPQNFQMLGSSFQKKGFYNWYLAFGRSQARAMATTRRSSDVKNLFLSRKVQIFKRALWVLPPLSNSWIITIIWLFIALTRTPNIDCYWWGQYPICRVPLGPKP